MSVLPQRWPPFNWDDVGHDIPQGNSGSYHKRSVCCGMLFERDDCNLWFVLVAFELDGLDPG